MNHTHPSSVLVGLLAAGVLLFGAAAAPLPGRPAAAFADTAVYAELDPGHVKDDLFGNLADTAQEVRVDLFLTAGSTLSLTLTPTATEDAIAATGLTLRLLDGTGADQLVTGGEHDISKGNGTLRWKKVPIATAGKHVLVLGAGTAGGYRLQLDGTIQKVVASGTGTDVAPNQELNVPITGVAGGSLSYSLASSGPKGFVGALVRIEQPDGFDLPMTPETATGKVTLAQDGTHVLYYKNAGSRNGNATASVTVKAPKTLRRRGFLRTTGTDFVPVMKSVDPARAFHKENALPLTLIGRDFQAGADVRLLRNGRDDIIATGVNVVSGTEITCVVNLDTTAGPDGPSVGTWTVGVFNAPVYTVMGDPTTLVKDTLTKSTTTPFASLSSTSIRLPSGVVKGSEVWLLDFNDAFTADLRQMGFVSSDDVTEDSARNAIEAYTVLFLRDLFRSNETTGALKKNVSAPISFIVASPPTVAGEAGVDYNRIEIGGPWQSGDARDVAEPLLWGFAPIDDGNAARNNLSVLDAANNRVGAGARTRVLDPDNSSSAQSWITAMQPLRTSPLTVLDRKYFTPGFQPRSQGEANRYRDIVNQVTRASREIAAIIAHHVGKAMGIPDEGTGPMANPAESGNLWPDATNLAFADGDIVSLLSLAKPHELPGLTRDLAVSYFPLLTTQAYLLPDLTTDVNYSATFNFVGGRPNASVSDYRVAYAAGSEFPRGTFTLSYSGLVGKAPTMLAVNTFYCDIEYLRIAVEDQKRRTTRNFLFRLNILPNVPLVPGPLQAQATACRNQVLSTQ